VLSVPFAERQAVSIYLPMCYGFLVALSSPISPDGVVAVFRRRIDEITNLINIV